MIAKIVVWLVQALIQTARNGSAPNWLNWNKFIVLKYEYLVILVTLVVVKNAAAWLKL